jgi:hypothetical protein
MLIEEASHDLHAVRIVTSPVRATSKDATRCRRDVPM